MEEKIPQLTLTPNLEEEPVLEPVKQEDLIEKSEKAPEAGPDLSMLSEAEQQAVLAFSKQIEILTEKIFAYVKEHPQDMGQIRQFLNYYLPTTIKLLEQYVVLQNQGMRMGNIDEGMKKIEDMLDKVIVAFQRQLDSLFESSVVDITADIQVMEQMMASEGLTGKDF